MKINNSMRNNNRNIWSRRLAFQAVYSWSVNSCLADEIISIFMEDDNFKKCDSVYFNEIVNGVISNIANIDDNISNNSEVAIENINIIELSIIRIFTYELIYNKKYPMEVLLSESVKLTKKFGGQDSYKLVNAFLEKLTKKISYEEN
jgi:N utilization substance protein B